MKNSIIDVRIGGKSLSISQDRQLSSLEDFVIVFIKTIEAAVQWLDGHVQIICNESVYTLELGASCTEVAIDDKDF